MNVLGIWKRRFHVLHSEVRMNPRKVCRIIGACAVLHNLAVNYREQEVVNEFGPGDGSPNAPKTNYIGQQNGLLFRQQYINRHF